ncbi:hypothetical protein PQX77_014083 [Marasmius sp. AFHP31]|nr:hypothetical protein PQX77_014083 [Marasmius sp. AFHP31]
MKAIGLDINERYAPFPSLFIIQEMRVRGFHPFEPTQSDIPDQVDYQDWIVTDGLQDGKGGFQKDAPKEKPSQHQVPTPLSIPPQHGSASSGGRRTLALNNDVIAEILAATRASPSWKACEMEGTSWTGTAEENIEKYISTIGAEES